MSMVWINGVLQHAHSGAVSALDQGLQLGLAVFDTLLVSHGCVLFVDEHVARLERSARAAALPWPPRCDPREGARALVAAIGCEEASLRLTYSAGAVGEGALLVVSARAVTQWPVEGVVVCVSSHVKLARDPLERIKHTNRLRNVLARAEAEAQGCHEALLPTEAGDLSEGTLSNVFVVRGDELCTPPLERGCLAGVTRDHVLESVRGAPRVGGRELRVSERIVEPSDVRAADEVLLTNTSGRVQGALEVRGLRERLPGNRGPCALELRARLFDLEHAYRSQVGRAAGTIATR